MKKDTVIARVTERYGEPTLPRLAIGELFKRKSVVQIRDWLEDHDMDRHMMLELTSTEIAFITPWGIMMQVRASDEGKLGLFGGVVNDGETVREGAIREVREKLGLKLKSDDLKWEGTDTHKHTYSNGDKVLFNVHRFVCQLEVVPDELELNSESADVTFVKNVNPDILKYQQDFVAGCIATYLK